MSTDPSSSRQPRLTRRGFGIAMLVGIGYLLPFSLLMSGGALTPDDPEPQLRLADGSSRQPCRPSSRVAAGPGPASGTASRP